MLNKSSFIDRIMALGLEKINTTKDLDIQSLFKKATDGEKRTTRIIIYEDGYMDNNEKILWDKQLSQDEKTGNKIVITNPNNPTVTYKMTMSAWLWIASQKRSFRDVFWGSRGKMKAEGEFFIRDYHIWSKFWAMYRDIVKLNYFEKLVLKTDNDEYL